MTGQLQEGFLIQLLKALYVTCIAACFISPAPSLGSSMMTDGTLSVIHAHTAKEDSSYRTYSAKTAVQPAVDGKVTDAHCFGAADGSIRYTFTGSDFPYTFQWSNGVKGKAWGNCSSYIRIINPASALKDYQVRIRLTFFPGMKGDFSDVLFTDTSGTTLYNFWKESYIDSDTAAFWVKIDSIPKGISYIKASYCNPSGTSRSNGPATFEYFDDFNDRDLSDWMKICQNINSIDETCDTSIVKVSENDYVVSLKSHAHCNGPATDGVRNYLRKTLTLPPGQYKTDLSTRFFICTHTNCPVITRAFARTFVGALNIFNYFVQNEMFCNCTYSLWTALRSMAYTSSGTPQDHIIGSEITDCGDGEVAFNDFRIRKFASDPLIAVSGGMQGLLLTELKKGKYTITLTSAGGNSETQTFTVNEPPEPSASNMSRCGNGKLTLEASGDYQGYRWYKAFSGPGTLSSLHNYTTDSLSRETTFYLTGIGDNGCETNPRTPVKVMLLLPDSRNQCLTLYNGISPNYDNTNERWIIDGIENYPQNEVLIFDRWGKLVFQRKNYNNSPSRAWRGKNNLSVSAEDDLPDDTYFYEIKVEGLEKPLSGFIILNREH